MSCRDVDRCVAPRERACTPALKDRAPCPARKVVEPLDGFSDDTGRRLVERPASPGWTDDEQAEVEKLRRREHELVVFVSTHRYWAELAGVDRVHARSRLKHAHEAPPPGGTEPSP
ncbi:hypothetical protein [Streptomyces hirsutus]|uniref:hypothetical protein n=1 Tax=Streptomyces hirsutus TaxID=35620 RepID=UPI003F4E440C